MAHGAQAVIIVILRDLPTAGSNIILKAWTFRRASSRFGVSSIATPFERVAGCRFVLFAAA
jgi:hypothetical protein